MTTLVIEKGHFYDPKFIKDPSKISLSLFLEDSVAYTYPRLLWEPSFPFH